MLAPPHLAFARQLRAGAVQRGGLVETSAFRPLLCTSCDVNVSGDHFNARVVVTHVFVNDGPAAVEGCLAFRTHPAWQVTLLRVDTIDKKFLLSQQQLRGEDRDKNAGGTPAGIVSDEHAAALLDTISAALPWTILSGQTVCTTLEFFVAMDVADADRSVFRLPGYVSVFDAAAGAAVGNNSNKPARDSWSGRFQQLSVPVPPSVAGNKTAGSGVTTDKCLTIRGQLAVPWAAPANVSASSAKVKAVFSKASTKQQQLARYGFVEFHFDTRSGTAADSFSANAEEEFVATLSRPSAVRDSTVAIESVSVAFDERAAASEQVAVAVSLAPNLALLSPNRAFPNAEVVFLVDCSSNAVHQWGARVRDALSAALRGLSSDSMFNVVFFAETAVRLFERSRYASEATLEAAEAFIAASALGGNSSNSSALGAQRRLFDALSTIYTDPNVAGYARTIVLLTNGGSDVNGQRSRVVDLVAANGAVAATIVAVALGKTADAALLQRLVECSGGDPAVQFTKVAQKYANNDLDSMDDAAASQFEDGNNSTGTSSSNSAKPPKRHNGVAAALCSALAQTLQPSLASVAVKFVSKTDGGVLPADRIRLATRMPLSIRSGRRAVVYALADASVPPCSILVTGLVGTEQQSFTGDFIGGAKAAEAHRQNAQAAGNAAVRTAASFDPVYVAAVTERLNLVEVFSVRSTLKPEHVAECRRLAGTVCLPANSTGFATRGSSSSTVADAAAATAWVPALPSTLLHAWVPASRRCGLLPPHLGSAGREAVSAAAVQKKSQQQQQQNVAFASSSSSGGGDAANGSGNGAAADSLFFALNAAPSATPVHAFLRETVEKMVTVAAAGDVASSFVRFQRLDGLWDTKNEAIWHAILVRLRNRNAATAMTVEALRGGDGGVKGRRPGSASDLASARWLAALVVASIRECAAAGEEEQKYDRSVGALAVKKAEAAMGGDANGLLERAKKHLGLVE